MKKYLALIWPAWLAGAQIVGWLAVILTILFVLTSFGDIAASLWSRLFAVIGALVFAFYTIHKLARVDKQISGRAMPSKDETARKVILEMKRDMLLHAGRTDDLEMQLQELKRSFAGLKETNEKLRDKIFDTRERLECLTEFACESGLVDVEALKDFSSSRSVSSRSKPA